MPRGVDPTILTALGKTVISGGFFYLFDVELRSGIRYWDKRGTLATDTGRQYEPRVLSVSDLQFSSDSAPQEVTLTVSNLPNGSGETITSIAQDESLYGCRVTIRQWVPSAGLSSVVWVGWLDEPQEITAERATLVAYADTPGMRAQIPRRLVTLTCPVEFANNANWVSQSEFDGSECVYPENNAVHAANPTIGFTGALVGAILAGTTSITVNLKPGTVDQVTQGMAYIVSDELRIENERLLVTGVLPISSNHQTLTVVRGWRSTTAAAHADAATVLYANCQKSTNACKCRGMYGNNPADTFLPAGQPSPGTRFRNYYGGFPVITGWEYGKFQTKDGKHYQTVGFAGNESAYDRPLPLVYGRCRVSNPILLLANAEGNFLTTLWLVAEGPLATNPDDDGQNDFVFLNGSTPTNLLAYQGTPNPHWHGFAYTQDPAPPRGYGNYWNNRYLRVNGALRQEFKGGSEFEQLYTGQQFKNGAQDEIEPGGNDADAGLANVFFPNAQDFTQNKLGLWGTAWAVIRIDTTNNPSIDVTGAQITGTMGIAYGRCVRVYSNATTYTHKATTNPAWVLLDMLASRRGGAGIPYSQINIQSFVDLAAYCNQTVTDTVNGGSIKRYTFNGALDTGKSFDEWVSLVAMSASSTRPFLDASGNYKVKALRALTSDEWLAVPVFSDKDATSRNILWENGMTTVTPFRRRRKDQIPNRIRANWVSLASAQAWITCSSTGGFQEYHSGDSHIYIKNGTGTFLNGDHVAFDGKGSHLVTSFTPASGGTAASIIISPTIQTSDLIDGKIRDGAPVANLSDYAKVQIIIEDEPSQIIYSGAQRNVVEKTIDLVGVSTLDEAVRRTTLVLRAGEFGEGGLSNNEGVHFKTFVDGASPDLEVGDVIALESNLLDPLEQRYYRITNITDHPIQSEQGAMLFEREIEAMLHDQDPSTASYGVDVSGSMYGDDGYTVMSLMPVDAGIPGDLEPPAVTSFSIVESGIVDANGTAMSKLIVSFTAPQPADTFRSLILMHSNDDGTGLAATGDWKIVAELTETTQEVHYPVTGKIEWFCALSRPRAGHLPNPDTELSDGSGYKYPRVSVLVDGMADSPLSTPTGLAAFGRESEIYLHWSPYTGTDLKLLKRYNVYRNTVNNSSTATLIDHTDTTWYSDKSSAVVSAPATTFYYWIRGVSKLESAVINGSTVDGLSSFSLGVSGNAGTDTAIPTAPVCAAAHDVISLGGQYTFLIGVDRPGGETNWQTVDTVEIQIARDSGFSAIVKDQTEELARPPWSYEYGVRPTEYGDYYFRARVKNIFGWSAWSTTAHETTDVANSTGDTDLLAVPANVAVLTSSTSNQINGDECVVQYDVPLTNGGTCWGRAIFADPTNTLPSSDYESTATTGNDYSSYAPTGTTPTGSITSGSNILTDLSKTWPTASGGLVGREVMIFSPKRPTSGTDPYAGAIIGTRVAANTAHTITLELPAEQQRYNGTVQYAILTSGGKWFFSKMKFCSGADEDLTLIYNPHANRTRQYRLPSADRDFYVWVSLFNLWGAGAMYGPTSQVTLAGITLDKVYGDGASPSAPTGLSGTAALRSVFLQWTNSADTDLIGTEVWGSNTNNRASATKLDNVAFPGATYIENPISSGTTRYYWVRHYDKDGMTGAWDPSGSTSGVAVTTLTATILNTEIAFGTITADRINVTDLFAQNISASGTITGGNIVGASLRTANSGARIVMDNTDGFQAYDVGGGLDVQIPVSGSDTGTILCGLIKASSLGNSIILSDHAEDAEFIVGSTKNIGAYTGPAGSLALRWYVDGVGNQILHYFDTVITSSHDLIMDSGHGMKDSGSHTSFVVSSTSAQIYAGGTTKVADFTTSALQLYIGGALRTILVDASDLGSGTKNYLYY